MKMISKSKLSKKAQRELNNAQRGSWNGVNPVARIIPDKKHGYNRARSKRESLSMAY